MPPRGQKPLGGLNGYFLETLLHGSLQMAKSYVVRLN